MFPLRWLCIGAVLLSSAPVWGQNQSPISRLHAVPQTKLDKALLDAARAGNSDKITDLLKRGANVNARDLRGSYFVGNSDPAEGQTALFLAIGAKSLSAVRVLISGGANVNADLNPDNLQDPDDLNVSLTTLHPLDYATKLNQTEIVRILLAAKANTYIDNQTGAGEAFRVAASYDALESMRLLLAPEEKAERAKQASKVIWWAANGNHLQMVRLLIENGANSESCTRALGEALQWKNLDIAEALLEHADLKRGEGYTPLIKHIQQQWPDITSLTQVGIDPQSLNVEESIRGEKYLQSLASERQRAADFITAMVARGANPNEICPGGYTPLLLAIEKGNFPFVKALLDSGANPNLAPLPFPSPLRFLARSGNLGSFNDIIDNRTDGSISPQEREKAQAHREEEDLKIAQMLVAKGAQVNSGDNRFALAEATMQGNVSLSQFLLKQGANPNLAVVPSPYFESPVLRGEITTKETAAAAEKQINRELAKIPRPQKQTPLLLAAKGGHPEIVRQLLDAGADANTHDSWGRNALHYLASYGRTALIFKWEQRVAIIDERNVVNHALPEDKLSEPLPKTQMALLSQWAAQGDGSITSELLSKGCSPTEPDHKGQTPLQIAIRQSDPVVVKAMLEANSQKMTTDSIFDVIRNGRRQVHFLPALRKLQLELIQSDRTDLWFSQNTKGVEKDHLENKARAKINKVKALAQRSQLLRQWGNVDASIVTELISHKVNPNTRNAAGLTPLMLAARLGQTEVVQALIQGGANLNTRSSSGESILMQIKKLGSHTLKSLPIDETADLQKEDSRQLSSGRVNFRTSNGQRRDVWLLPKPILAREALIRHILATEDATLSSLLRQSGAN